MKNLNVLLPVFLFAGITTSAQVFTNKEVGKKNEEIIDSLKKADYPYTLPIWGQKATSAGYELPYSAGFSSQYVWQESDIAIDNLNVGFNNGPMYNLDGLVRFNRAKATANVVSVRPDIWLLPFLNVYAILGKTRASTDVGFGVWIPDSSGTDKEIFSAGSVVDFNATSFGFGITPTIGVAGGFLALDMNVAWTDVPQLSKPARSFVFGPRMGKNFKLKKPGQTVAVWVGGFRVNINSETNGSIAMDEVISGGDFGSKIDQGQQKVDNAQQQVDAWWASLTPQQQNNPVNRAKYETANNVLDRAGQVLAAAENAVNNIGTSTIQYSMDKKPQDPWNILVGAQFQVNKHLMFRAEYGGFTGSRTQFLGGIQYRFGL